MSNLQLYGQLTKEANPLFDDIKGGFSGAQKAFGDTSFKDRIFNPIDTLGKTYGGFTGGYGASAVNREVAPLEQNGLAFKRDQYGKPINIDLGGTIKGFGNKLLGGLTAGANNLVPGAGGWLNTAFDWIKNNPGTSMLGGLGALGGTYLLKQLLFPSRPAPRYGRPVPYYGAGYMPQGGMPMMFEKSGGMFNSLPQPLTSPTAMAELVTSGGAPQQAPQPPKPNLQQLMQDPRMRDYLTVLLNQRNQR